ncbi:MAG: ABC transporter ATP-binding protein [Lachnotalea sp.]
MFKIDNISKQYANGYWAIKNFSLEVSEGEIVCLSGPNGSGKTTLINCIFGIINPTNGKAYIDEYKFGTIDFKKNVIYVPDEILLIEALTGKEYIDFVSKIYVSIKEQFKNNLISLFNIDTYMNEPIKTYSHGMKKKIQIIAAFMVNSNVIILDEPYRGLDVESIIILKKLLKKYVSNGGSIIISSHDLISAEQICNRMAIILYGNLIELGSISELKEKYQTDDIDEVFLKCSLEKDRGDDIEKLIDSL